MKLYNLCTCITFLLIGAIADLNISLANETEPQVNDKNLTFVTTTFPPFTIHTKSNTDSPGLINEIVNEAFKDQGYNADIEIYPWMRAQKMALAGSVTGTFSSTKSKEYEDAFYYSKPFSHLAAAYFTQKDYNGPPLTTLESAKGIKVAANLGYSLSRLLTEAEIKHTTVRDEISGIRLMLKGRVDAYLAYTRPVFWNQAAFGNRLQDEKIRFHRVKNFPYYLIISKKHENGLELIHLFNQSIRAMIKTGRLSEIMDNYLEKFIVIN